jgi:hypothetical protein
MEEAFKMKIFSVMVSDGTGLHSIGAIEYENNIWLVPVWIESPHEGWKKPERIIRLRRDRFQSMPPGFQANFFVPLPIPKVVFSGRVPPELASEYEVVENPQIRIEIPKGIH